VNHLDGLMPLADWRALDVAGQLVDVRDPDEFEAGHVPGARNLPLSQLRERYGELDAGRPVTLYCGVGQRAYYATRFLAQHGYRAANLSGGYATYCALVAGGVIRAVP
jgi:rhodanese-related sulfurtransferase